MNQANAATGVAGRNREPQQVNAGQDADAAAHMAEVSQDATDVHLFEPMTDKLTDKQREAILAKIPANRAGTAEEVAAAVAFLATNEAGYVTGQTLHVNGGMAMI